MQHDMPLGGTNAPRVSCRSLGALGGPCEEQRGPYPKPATMLNLYPVILGMYEKGGIRAGGEGLCS